MMVDQAVALNANLSNAWTARAWVSLMVADGERTKESFHRSLRINPVDPNKYWHWSGHPGAASFSSNTKRAVCATRAMQAGRNPFMLRAFLVNAAFAGRLNERMGSE